MEAMIGQVSITCKLQIFCTSHAFLKFHDNFNIKIANIDMKIASIHT